MVTLRQRLFHVSHGFTLLLWERSEKEEGIEWVDTESDRFGLSLSRLSPWTFVPEVHSRLVPPHYLRKLLFVRLLTCGLF